MSVRYSGVANRHSYLCARQRIEYGGAVCQCVAGPVLDQFVVQQVLAALEPAALELSLTAAQQLERERADLERLWQQRRERAAYSAERAGRQYRLAEPENRLVVRQLEREWEERLVEQEQRVHHLGGDDADADENENKCGSSHGKFLLTNRIFVRV